MARLLTCPHGHQWHPPADGPPDAGARCPACGAAPVLPPRTATAESVTLPEMAPAAGGAAGRPVAIPDHEILGELGRGGMGVVYKARHRQLGRLVALKMVRVGALVGEADLARFRAEAEAVARLQHPNIVQVYEVGEGQGLPYFSLEFCPGGSLAARLNGTPLPPLTAAQVAETLARAMHAAHEAGVVHRDLKPANVLLVPSQRPEAVALGDEAAERFEPKVTDFGLAKRLDLAGSSLTQSGAIVGTPSYMAPEQAAGQTKTIGPAADVYALGAVLYECLTGRPPFRAATLVDTILQVLDQEPVPPGRLNAGVPRDLETICLKCLAKEPARRYASALDLADDLRRFRQGEPIRARPMGRLERAARWARRNPALAGSLAAVVLALAAGTAVSAGFAVQAAYQAEQARGSAADARKAQADLQQANADLTAERDRTKAALEAEAKRRRQAREALDALTGQVVEGWLARQKQLLPEHKEFLQRALASYEEFARDTGPDEATRAGVAAAYQRVGRLDRLLGQTREAEAASAHGRDAYARLAADFPANPEYAHELAQSHTDLGILFKSTGRPHEAEAEHRAALAVYRGLPPEFLARPELRRGRALSHNHLAILYKATGRPREAEAEYREALALQKQLVADFPGSPEFRWDLAQSYFNLSILCEDGERWPEAEAACREALALQKRLVDESPGNPEYRHELAGSYNGLGQALLRAGQAKAAAEAYGKALALHRQLTVEFPTRPDYRQELATSYNNLGILDYQAGHPQEAEAAYREALPIHRRLADEFPAVPDYHNDLAAALVNFALLRRQQGQLDEARRLLLEAVPHHQAALRASPRHPTYRLFYRNNRLVLGDTLLQLGRHAEAAAVADDLARAAVRPAEDVFEAARTLARCVPLAEKDAKLPGVKQQELAKAYADRALALMRQAVAKGYKDVDRLKKDTDLDPLRKRDDFRRLLAELEKPKPVGK
jgi:tetratricopeptide (TPR) repeat protein/tRNA A-37 threonylcarbamoyl transferase component Bud32